MYRIVACSMGRGVLLYGYRIPDVVFRFCYEWKSYAQPNRFMRRFLPCPGPSFSHNLLFNHPGPCLMRLNDAVTDGTDRFENLVEFLVAFPA